MIVIIYEKPVPVGGLIIKRESLHNISQNIRNWLSNIAITDVSNAVVDSIYIEAHHLELLDKKSFDELYQLWMDDI